MNDFQNLFNDFDLISITHLNDTSALLRPIFVLWKNSIRYLWFCLLWFSRALCKSSPHAIKSKKRPYAPVCLQLMASALVSSCVAGYWLDPWARSFRFSMTGRYGTRYAAPSLSRPKCCFSPFASQFWKDSCSVKNRSSEKLFWFFMWNLKKERCFTRLENDWGSNSGKKAKLFFSFVKIVSFSVDWKFWKKFLWLVVKIMMFWQKKTFVSWRKKLELNKYEKVWCFFR